METHRVPSTGLVRSGLAALVIAAVIAAVMAGCAKNPVTGQRQLMLISEDQEFSIGEGADKEIRKEYGSYLDSPSLRGYVDGVGNSLAKRGERPSLVFHFEVLNSPEINAFALPGGFVYVTRGMLERLSSEDELAMVVGHEVGHVTARHGAARISRMYALQYGSLVGAIISPRTFANYNDLINLALAVGLSKYSREQESEADHLGVTYAAGAGYRPESGVTVMKILKWMEGKEPSSLEKWFLSHPPADERITDIRQQVRMMEQRDAGVKDRRMKRDAYLKQIDGLIVGLYNGSEMVLKDRYYNKEVAVSLKVPSGWDVNLDPNSALMSMSEKGKEYMQLEATPMRTSVEADDVQKKFEETLRRRGWTRTSTRRARTGQEVAAHLATYKGSNSKGEPIGVLCAFLARGKHEWTFTAVSGLERFENKKGEYETEALDIAFLSDAEAEALQPPRLRVRPAPAGATWASLAQEHMSDTGAAERLAFYNGMDPNAPIGPGMLVKIPPSLAVHP